MLEVLPEGSGLLGTAFILLGANVFRKYKGIAANPNTTFIGLFSLLTGGMIFTLTAFRSPVEAVFGEIMMIVMGTMLLGYALLGPKKQITN